MDVIKDWAVMICAVAIGSAFCVFLIPDGKLKKPAETGVVIIVLILICAPLRNNSLPDFQDVFKIESVDDSFEPDVVSFYGKYAEYIITSEIEKILVSLCEKNSESEITLITESENEIVLQNIIIYIDEADIDKKTEIIKQVGNLSGIVPEVVIMVEN